MHILFFIEQEWKIGWNDKLGYTFEIFLKISSKQKPKSYVQYMVIEISRWSSRWYISYTPCYFKV